MSSKMQLRMVGEKIAALLGKSKEKIGVLTILHNEPRVTLKVSITDGYLTEIPMNNLYCKELSEYYPWIKTSCVTGCGMDEPPIDKTYYVKSSNPYTIEVTICEYSESIPYTRAYTLSIEKHPSPEDVIGIARDSVPSRTLPVILDSGVLDYAYDYEYGQLDSIPPLSLKNIIKDISPPKLTRATHHALFCAEEEM